MQLVTSFFNISQTTKAFFSPPARNSREIKKGFLSAFQKQIVTQRKPFQSFFSLICFNSYRVAFIICNIVCHWRQSSLSYMMRTSGPTLFRLFFNVFVLSLLQIPCLSVMVLLTLSPNTQERKTTSRQKQSCDIGKVANDAFEEKCGFVIS